MHGISARFESIRNRRSRRFVLSVWLIISGIALSVSQPARVEGSCGDYLAHGELMSLHEYTRNGEPDADTSFPLQNSSGRIPCHGPFCQQGPAPSPLSTPVVSIEPHDRWGWMANIIVSAPTRFAFLTLEREQITSPMIAYRLDRPPKV